MGVLAEPALERVARLQRCVGDLTSLLALPAIWSGGDARHVVKTLTDTLFGMLRLDFVSARFTEPFGARPIELMRERPQAEAMQAGGLAQALRRRLGEDLSQWPRLARVPGGESDLSLLSVQLGLNGELGTIVAASARADFPNEVERLVLGVAANLASIGLREAHQLDEHMRRAARLDQEAARAAVELSEANQALTRELSERARTEQILRRRDLEFRLVVDSIPVLVAVTTPTSELEGVNQAATDYFGKTFEELERWEGSDVVHPDDLANLIAARHAAQDAGDAYNVECRHQRADGVYRWFKVIGLPLRDREGRILRWFHLQMDIHDHKRAEIHLAGEKQALEMIASGRSLRDILEALCNFFEDAATDCLCGLYPIDGRGDKFQYGVAPSLPASYTAPVEGTPVGRDNSPRGLSVHEKAQVIAADIGSDPRWMAASCRAHVLKYGVRAVWSTPICSREGAVIGTFCVYQRASGTPSVRHQELIAHVVHLASIAIERAQSEDVLKRSEFYLTEGQRISLTGSFSWRIDTDEIVFSRELHRIFEFAPNARVTLDLIGQRIHPDDLETMAAKFAQARAGHDVPDYEMRLIAPEGRIKHIWVCARVLRHEDGRLECLGAVQDITPRKTIEEARDKMQSELARVGRIVSLGALTASIAHEVNQPLAAIVTNGETTLRWLSQSEPDLERVRNLATRIVGDAHRAADIIGRIRATAARGAAGRSLVALNDVIRESTSFLRHELEARAVSVALDLVSDLPMVLGDRTQLQQVVVNLVINAIQAMTTSPALRRSVALRTCRIDADTVGCVVEDSGGGIDESHLPRLFESFFSTKESGMGLGLPIAQSIVDAHNGSIRADNKSSLGGARFVFELPACLHPLN